MKTLYGQTRLAGAVSEQMLAEARRRVRYQFERAGRIVSLTETLTGSVIRWRAEIDETEPR